MRQRSRPSVIVLAAAVEAACAANSQVVRTSEAMILSQLRSLAGAEAAYQSVNGGGYDTLQCLAQPASCIPNYPRDAPSFLPDLVPSAEQAGYRGRFHAGPRLPVLPSGVVSPSGMISWAYTAVPRSRRSGWRAFCIDCTGRICTTGNRHEPEVVKGVCSPSCTSLADAR